MNTGPSRASGNDAADHTAAVLGIAARLNIGLDQALLLVQGFTAGFRQRGLSHENAVESALAALQKIDIAQAHVLLRGLEREASNAGPTHTERPANMPERAGQSGQQPVNTNAFNIPPPAQQPAYGAQPNTGQPYPGQSYPGQSYPGQPYPQPSAQFPHHYGPAQQYGPYGAPPFSHNMNYPGQLGSHAINETQQQRFPAPDATGCAAGMLAVSAAMLCCICELM